MKFFITKSYKKGPLQLLFLIKFLTNFTIMKKAWAFGLLVVMLLVSFLPCADAKAFGSPVKTKLALTKTHRQGNHQQDVCPPFCQCQCCSIVSFYQPAQTELLPVAGYHPPYLSQPEKAAIHKPHDIWQPPQL